MQGRAPLEASLTSSCSGGMRTTWRRSAAEGTAAGGVPSGGEGLSGEVPPSEPSPDELVPLYPGASEAEDPSEGRVLEGRVLVTSEAMAATLRRLRATVGRGHAVGA